MRISDVGADVFGEPDAAVLRVLASQVRAVSGREVARLSGQNQSSTRRALARWRTVGLVRGDEHPHATLFSLNRQHVLWEPIERILASPARVEQVIAEMVHERTRSRGTVALFGSVARGDSGPDSDIDLVLVAGDGMRADEIERLRDDLTETVEELTGNTVQVVEVTRAQLRRMARDEDPLVESWRRESRTLSGEDLTRVIGAA
ncbi:Nucleotidyltransferase domain protein [Clavibacter michiganensis]|uniref:Nucleotidyltransferase domain protein n=1 Tax=Clavibacter michiganensis TaxID=28447 RepID=A0A251YDU6_9MICO|nr:nucleotidyltransferase domain-containing protein [Clavibacter michiganensis]OUE22386.1 Nucleotidyltransferase domain protein [Clavibacter michiganensis]